MWRWPSASDEDCQGRGHDGWCFCLSVCRVWRPLADAGWPAHRLVRLSVAEQVANAHPLSWQMLRQRSNWHGYRGRAQCWRGQHQSELAAPSRWWVLRPAQRGRWWCRGRHVFRAPARRRPDSQAGHLQAAEAEARSSRCCGDCCAERRRGGCCLASGGRARTGHRVGGS